MFLICLLVGCGTSGEATVELSETGGFADGFRRGVLISGDDVTYRMETISETVSLSRSDREAIFAALDDIDFLSLDLDPADCTLRGADFPTATIHADLPAGSNTVEYDTSCEGAVYDRLRMMNETIYEISGFNDWKTPKIVPLSAE